MTHDIRHGSSDPKEIHGLERILKEVDGSLVEVMLFIRSAARAISGDPKVRGGAFPKFTFHDHTGDLTLCDSVLTSGSH